MLDSYPVPLRDLQPEGSRDNFYLHKSPPKEATTSVPVINGLLIVISTTDDLLSSGKFPIFTLDLLPYSKVTLQKKYHCV